jgi:hypothetical protein
MDDKDVLDRISSLVEEEKKLRANAHGGHPLEAEERARMEELSVQLDQCWDLLRRREAREEFGQDPEQEHVMPADVVEGYEQ